MKSIDKLREMCKYRHLVVNTSMTSDGTTVANLGSPSVETIDDIIGNIEAEIERDYMPKPKIEKCFNAINSGITDISEALQNIAECNAAKCAMRQEVTHADVETMIGSIAAIADAYYMRLPQDANNKPIHVGDVLECDANGYKGTFTVFAIGNDTVVGNHDIEWIRDNPYKWFHVASYCYHVKPRTLEDVLIEYRLKAYNLYADQELTGEERVDEFKKLDAEYDSEISELLGGDE